MKAGQQRVAVIVAVPGIVACVAALAAFLLKIVQNRLPWAPLGSVREYYLVVGQAFSTGFATGFFLCFFLMLAAVAMGTWFEQRAARLQASEVTADVRTTPDLSHS